MILKYIVAFTVFGLASLIGFVGDFYAFQNDLITALPLFIISSLNLLIAIYTLQGKDISDLYSIIHYTK